MKPPLGAHHAGGGPRPAVGAVVVVELVGQDEHASTRKAELVGEDEAEEKEDEGRARPDKREPEGGEENKVEEDNPERDDHGRCPRKKEARGVPCDPIAHNGGNGGERDPEPAFAIVSKGRLSWRGYDGGLATIDKYFLYLMENFTGGRGPPARGNTTACT